MQHSTRPFLLETEEPMPEPSVPEMPSLEHVPQRRTAWARGVPVALTGAIFLSLFWRIPFGAF